MEKSENQQTEDQQPPSQKVFPPVLISSAQYFLQGDTRNSFDLLLAKENEALVHIEGLYKKYSSDVSLAHSVPSLQIKQSFDEYMSATNQTGGLKFASQQINQLKKILWTYEDRINEVEQFYGRESSIPTEYMEVPKAKNFIKGFVGYFDPSSFNFVDGFFITKDLRIEFFRFYTVLVKFWLGIYLRKCEIREVRPGLLLILSSLVLRKFGQEIDLRWV